MPSGEHRWSPCCLCGEIYPEVTMLHATVVGRKRGRVCKPCVQRRHRFRLSGDGRAKSKSAMEANQL